MRLDDSLNYSPWHIYRVPGALRYATKLALDARYGEGRWRAPYAPIIERSPPIEFEVGGRADFIREGVRPGDVGIAREISTQIAFGLDVSGRPE